MSAPDVLDRIAAANPVPAGPPPQAWSAAVLLDEIDERRGTMTKLETVQSAPPEGPRRAWRSRLAVAVGAFALVFAVVGLVALVASGGTSGPATPAPTTVAPTTIAPATSVPVTPPPPAVDPVEAGRAFIEAMDASDAAAAAALLDPNAVFDDLAGSVDDLGPVFDWQTSFDLRWTVRSCEQSAIGPPALVTCEYDTQSLLGRAVPSDALAGSYDFEIVDGLITKLTHDFRGLGGWDEFAQFVRSDSDDFDVMYTDATGRFATLTPESNALWREHSARFLAERFYLRYTNGDTDGARSMALSSGVVPAGFAAIIDAFGVTILDIACTSITPGTLVECRTTQVDDFTRKVSPAYTYSNVGRISVGGGVVRDADSRLDDDPIFDRYAVWLDETGPGRWFELGCTDGGWFFSTACVEIMVAPDTVDAWLATGPDLGELGA